MVEVPSPLIWEAVAVPWVKGSLLSESKNETQNKKTQSAKYKIM